MMDRNLAENEVRLGATDLFIPRMGIGAWAWGERIYWGYGRSYGEDDVRQAFESSLEADLNFIDTAEIYGHGNSERLVGKFSRQARQPVIIATKFMPYPWRLSKGRLLAALQGSLNRLGRDQVDLYQIHSPASLVSIQTWVEGLVEAVEKGLAHAVGVSNYRVTHMRRVHSALKKRNIPLASNQVEYHLLNRTIEHNGVLNLCQELGVTLLAYSPLAQGMLTGKYTPQNPPSGVRGLRYRPDFLAKIRPLIRLLSDIGREHGGKTPAQVALNWTLCKGTVPIVGVKDSRQLKENIGALGWQLPDDHVLALDEASKGL
jgi:aryl-alcohol dehydrogenase-like predicted oxidoreductase